MFRSLNSLAKAFSLASFIFLASATVFGQGAAIYDNIPNPLPGNLVSEAFEAQSASEFGDQIAFPSTTGRNLMTATVTMSSWGCESGSWYAGDCSTTTGATFSHPITLNFYRVGTGNAVGTLLATKTQTFNIPYRPSADLINCPDGRWFNGTSCFNGFATNITFDLSSLGTVLPDEVIVSVAFNTTHYGGSPMGQSASCYTSSGGCGYDSLNVGLADPETYNLVGDNPFPADAYLSSTWSGAYCAAGMTGTFVLDAGCWTGIKPALRINAAFPATTANDCKNGGWRSHTTAAGASFPNQGQCMQYVNTGR